ncbi:MAG TPA: family 43 glycosylhydrolase [Opitutaceae bacterium]|nr:family 43 glycosylhydrolase [Opitutaceae bacterium]
MTFHSLYQRVSLAVAFAFTLFFVATVSLHANEGPTERRPPAGKPIERPREAGTDLLDGQPGGWRSVGWRSVDSSLAGSRSAALPWGDQGDGTFKNPVLFADYSDPDVIRVGKDFYLVASDFHFVGIQVLHSRDLVNWTIIGQVFDRLTMSPKYDEMAGYAQGTWAPSLRFHDGKFYLYVCTPADGLFLYTTKNPAGPWDPAVTVKAVEKWEDPCPFWDDDGQAYLVHSLKGAGPLILHKLSADGTKLLDDGKEIYRGPTAEGPKLFKRNGWYYISLPERGVERGGQTVLRSKNIYGPYERRVVFPDGSPHQGGIVDLESGESWFLSFKSTGAFGRVVHLNPVTWGADDWPVFGNQGQPISSGKKPRVAATASSASPSTTASSHSKSSSDRTGAEGASAASLFIAEDTPMLPQRSDDFSSATLNPQWQWNHNPVNDAWSLRERAGWLRLHGLPAADLTGARNTLTQKLWGPAGDITVKIDARSLAPEQRAGLAFMSGKAFAPVGVVNEHGKLRLFWDTGAAPQGEDAPVAGPAIPDGQNEIWLRGTYDGNRARLAYSFDGRSFTDTGMKVTLKFGQWKGARIALFSYGPGQGHADFSNFQYELRADDDSAIDRYALVTRHNPVNSGVAFGSPLTVGNGGFCFTVDATGLQTFGDDYYRQGIPLETLARWAWITDENPNHYTLADASKNFTQANGRVQAYPTRASTPAGDWLRKNPRDQPLAQVSLDWKKADGSAFTPADLENPEQTLNLWTGTITSRYRLGGVPVTVNTACDPHSDRIAVTIDSELVSTGKLRARIAFPRGHDSRVKNTPPLDWSAPESHVSRSVSPNTVQREVSGLEYFANSDRALKPEGTPHVFTIEPAAANSSRLEFTLGFARERSAAEQANSTASSVISAATVAWEHFWQTSAVLDLSGSTDPRAAELERRVVLSQYLTAVQLAGDVPPQESGLTCSTWYGKHHTEMLWWHAAHFALWGHPELLEKNLAWYQAHLPDARALAESRGLRGARWAKMVGPDDRESPGGNPLIVWNQPHLIYLCELLYRRDPTPATLAKYRDLVLETADCMSSMTWFDPKRGEYVLGPPLWIAQEIYDQATSQNPSFELAYWRWALGVAQTWRERLHAARDAETDRVIEKLSPLPQRDGRYVALESNPDTWDNIASRHDHPEMLMPLGFLPETPAVDRATMNRTLDAVLTQWDWETKIWGWDYPMIAMTATRLGRPSDAVDVLVRNGPNNVYLANGHCPQRSDVAMLTRSQPAQGSGSNVSPESRPKQRTEIAVYLPANGSLLSAVALMVAGWDGNKDPHPGFPKDGTWHVRAEGWQALP